MAAPRASPGLGAHPGWVSVPHDVSPGKILLTNLKAESMRIERTGIQKYISTIKDRQMMGGQKEYFF